MILRFVREIDQTNLSREEKMSAAQFVRLSQSLMMLSLPFASTYVANRALNITKPKAALASTLGAIAVGGIVLLGNEYAKQSLSLSKLPNPVVRICLNVGALSVVFLGSKLAGKQFDSEFTFRKAIYIQALAIPVTLIAAVAIGKFDFSHFMKQDLCPNIHHIPKEFFFGLCA